MALIAGSIGGLVTMAMHPTTGGAATAAQFDHMASISGIAHSLAIASATVMLLGVLGLARYLWDRERLALAAATVFALAMVSVLIATAVSGFIVPTLLRHMAHDDQTYVGTWHIVIDAIFQLNQTFSKIYSVASSVSILLFSIAVLRGRLLGRGLAIYGCILAPIVMLAIGSGHLRMDVHGMAAVVVGQALWYIGAGLQLRAETDVSA